MKEHKTDGLTAFLGGIVMVPVIFVLFVVLALVWKPLAILLLAIVVISLVVSLINDYRRNGW